MIWEHEREWQYVVETHGHRSSKLGKNKTTKNNRSSTGSGREITTNLGKVREKRLVLLPFQHLARKPRKHTYILG